MEEKIRFLTFTNLPAGDTQIGLYKIMSRLNENVTVIAHMEYNGR